MKRTSEWVVTVEVWATDPEDAAEQAAQAIHKGEPVDVQSVTAHEVKTVQLRAS